MQHILNTGISDGMITEVEKENTEFWDEWIDKECSKTKNMFSYNLSDFSINEYKSYPIIKFPLSN